jgi:PAS domain S-box-containing protein
VANGRCTARAAPPAPVEQRSMQRSGAQGRRYYGAVGVNGNPDSSVRSEATPRPDDSTQSQHGEEAGLEQPSRSAEVHVQDVIDALPGAVIVADADGRIVVWSSLAEQLFGWRDVEVRDRPVATILTPTSDIADSRPSVEAGDPHVDGLMVTRRDGSTVGVSAVRRSVVDRDGSVVAVVHWIDENPALFRAEQQSRDLSEHLRAVVEAGGLGTWRWDAATGVVLWDERLEALFGLPADGFDGRFETFVSLVHPDDREALVCV